MATLKNVIIIVFVVTILGTTLSCAGNMKQTGTLEGTVRIGPIWPVERPGENPPVPPGVFEARKIMIYDRNGKRLIEQVDIVQVNHSQEGQYSVQLETGTYVVDINHIGIDRSAEVPKEVEIKVGQTVKLDIEIDTGIR